MFFLVVRNPLSVLAEVEENGSGQLCWRVRAHAAIASDPLSRVHVDTRPPNGGGALRLWGPRIEDQLRGCAPFPETAPSVEL